MNDLRKWIRIYWMVMLAMCVTDCSAVDFLAITKVHWESTTYVHIWPYLQPCLRPRRVCDLIRLSFDNLAFNHDDENTARSIAQVKCSLLPAQILVCTNAQSCKRICPSPILSTSSPSCGSTWWEGGSALIFLRMSAAYSSVTERELGSIVLRWRSSVKLKIYLVGAGWTQIISCPRQVVISGWEQVVPGR